jgi:hypothetical protein
MRAIHIHFHRLTDKQRPGDVCVFVCVRESERVTLIYFGTDAVLCVCVGGGGWGGGGVGGC